MRVGGWGGWWGWEDGESGEGRRMGRRELLGWEDGEDGRLVSGEW